MAKVGISVRIDVTKIDKSRLFKGEKGTYLNLTTFVDLDNKDQYEKNGFISQEVTKEEQAQKVQTPILGNVKVFWSDRQSANQTPQAASSGHAVGGDSDYYNDDIPF